MGSSQSTPYAATDIFDLRLLGKVPEVEGQPCCCSSCWSISATTCVASSIALRTGSDPVPLSFQEVCDNAYIITPYTGPPSRDGRCCQVNRCTDALYYIKFHGVAPAADYPLHSGMIGHSGIRARCGGQVNLSGRTDSEINDFIRTNGPIAADIQIGETYARLRTGEIYHGLQSGETSAGLHTVTIIGWGEKPGEPYYIFKCSYPWICDGGYGRMGREVPRTLFAPVDCTEDVAY